MTCDRLGAAHFLKELLRIDSGLWLIVTWAAQIKAAQIKIELLITDLPFEPTISV